MRDYNRELYSMPTNRRPEQVQNERGFDQGERRSVERDGRALKEKIKFGIPILILVPDHYNEHIQEKQVCFLERVKDITRVHHIYTD
jgi:hypothetical protein